MKTKKRWVCIDNSGYESELVYGKVYEEITNSFADPGCIVIKNEMGIVSEYYQYWFQEIDEWRQSQLGKLGI